MTSTEVIVSNDSHSTGIARSHTPTHTRRLIPKDRKAPTHARIDGAIVKENIKSSTMKMEIRLLTE